MQIDTVPDELPDARARQWRDALYILNGIAGEKGLTKATLTASVGLEMWELEVRLHDGGLKVHGPSTYAGQSVSESWFQCHLEIEITEVGLQDLAEWMEVWHGFDRVFFPALLVEGKTCRSHRVGDSETFTFVWE